MLELTENVRAEAQLWRFMGFVLPQLNIYSPVKNFLMFFLLILVKLTLSSLFFQRLHVLQQVKVLFREMILWVSVLAAYAYFPELYHWTLESIVGELTLERCPLTSNIFEVASVSPRT